MTLSTSSVISKSAHRLRFVNSYVGSGDFCCANGDDDVWDGPAAMVDIAVNGEEASVPGF